MDIANLDSINNKHSTSFCNYFKVPNLTEAILDATQVSNLKDRYVLGEQLGWGQFGVIRACSDKLTGEVLACKSISKDKLITLDNVRSVKLEIEIMTQLSGHPNVVDLKAVYEGEDYVHLVMELCAGGELFHRLEKYGRFSEFDARVLFRDLMQVLKFCHDNGIVHRDLKPENILFATTSSSSPIKLADFGLATYIQSGQRLHGTVGSPFYIAPEVLAGGYNQAADVWSAGVILYILLSGMPPFWGKTKSKIFNAVKAADLRFPSDPWDEVSESARDLISAMLCTDPSRRFTAGEVLAHSWMEHCSDAAQEPCNNQNGLGCRELEYNGGSFSTSIIARNQDYSFGECQLEQSPAFTCKSSFSSFLVDDIVTTPGTMFGGFSFTSCCETTNQNSSSPVPSMPSFSFFSPQCADKEGALSMGFKVSIPKMDEICAETNSVKPLILQDFSLPTRREIGETEQKSESRKGGGGSNGSRISGIHSKRNHTIGVGEFDQLDVLVTESVIRWASCTHIPTAPSLRLSLVC